MCRPLHGPAIQRTQRCLQEGPGPWAWAEPVGGTGTDAKLWLAQACVQSAREVPLALLAGKELIFKT